MQKRPMLQYLLDPPKNFVLDLKNVFSCQAILHIGKSDISFLTEHSVRFVQQGEHWSNPVCLLCSLCSLMPWILYVVQLHISLLLDHVLHLKGILRLIELLQWIEKLCFQIQTFLFCIRMQMIILTLNFVQSMPVVYTLENYTHPIYIGQLVTHWNCSDYKRTCIFQALLISFTICLCT